MQQTSVLMKTKHCWCRTSKTVDDEEESSKETKATNDIDATVYESCMHTVTWKSLKAISTSLHLGVDLMP